MNSLVVMVIAVIALWLGYCVIGRYLERLWEVDPQRKTPAFECGDGVDYVPAKHWSMLFGHHFASIAGAGPIIGPVIACALWGWGPALLWIIFGSIFIGAVHDFSALMVSLRRQGKSIAEVCETVISRRVRIIFAAFLWLTLLLVIAVFAAAGASALAKEPRVVIPTFGMIPLAIILGWFMYKRKANQATATIIGIALLFCLILVGYYYPVDLGEHAFDIWLIALLVYAALASVMPVNVLLQPRDYLSAVVLFLGLGFGFLGLIITHPPMHAPMFTSFEHATRGPLWPMMFVTVACGAISGFHSMVASGTTSKQLASEADAKKVVTGAMILEGVLATLAMVAVCAGLTWGVPGSSMNYPEMLKEKGWIATFGAGYGELTKPLFGTFGILIAITTLKTFVLTTLDSATRIGRYLTEELFGNTLKLNIFRNRFFATGMITAIALTLAVDGRWKKIWPVFGASNQLVAALALIIVSLVLLSKCKPVAATIYPAVFMLLVTIGALVWQLGGFIKQENYLLAAIDGLLLLLAAGVIVESIIAKARLQCERKN